MTTVDHAGGTKRVERDSDPVSLTIVVCADPAHRIVLRSPYPHGHRDRTTAPAWHHGALDTVARFHLPERNAIQTPGNAQRLELGSSRFTWVTHLNVGAGVLPPVARRASHRHTEQHESRSQHHAHRVRLAGCTRRRSTRLDRRGRSGQQTRRVGDLADEHLGKHLCRDAPVELEPELDRNPVLGLVPASRQNPRPGAFRPRRPWPKIMHQLRSARAIKQHRPFKTDGQTDISVVDVGPNIEVVSRVAEDVVLALPPYASETPNDS